MKITHLVLMSAFALTAGCLHEPSEGPEPEIDISFFNSVWEQYEAMYPLFVFKDIDWMEIGASYYTLAEKAESNEEMVEIITDMLAVLEDPAIVIYCTNGDVIYPFQREYQSNVDTGVLMENYLEPNGYAGYVDGFGWCDPAVLPYAYFDKLPSGHSSDSVEAAAFDDFIGQCVENDVPAVILDIRMNPSGKRAGFGWFDHLTMSRFLEYNHVGAVYRYRVGPEYDMYGDWHPAVVPSGPNRYLGTVYLLAGGGCTQAAEDMVANMEYFPNTVVVGDTTAGSSSYTGSSASFSPEGYGISWNLPIVTATLLTHDFQWIEGVGVAPDVYVEATESDFAAGVDPVLEYAIEQLN